VHSCLLLLFRSDNALAVNRQIASNTSLRKA
jgi:hypothetical protein